MQWIVGSNDQGLKLASFIQKEIQAIEGKAPSYRQVKRFIDAGLSSVNGKIERFHHRPLVAGDTVSLLILERSKKEISILFEDADLLIIDKPIGVVSDEKLEKKLHAFLVHRLDKETSGCLVLAKTKEIREILFTAFREREIDKEYVALISGRLPQNEGQIENYLTVVSRYQGGVRYGVSATSKGDFASTKWCVEKIGKGASLVRLIPLTGRTHQLRVEMAYLGAPIIGDSIYGEPVKDMKIPQRLMLHAEKVSFLHPVTHERVEIIAPIPDDFSKACEILCGT